MRSLVLTLAVLATAVFLITRCVAPDPTPPVVAAAQPHIILVMVDALRSDHISAYGYPRQTTPNLDTVAAAGATFVDASVPAPWTFPSNAAMLTGYLPSHLGVLWADDASRLPDETHLLAEWLHDRGYATAGFTASYYTRGRFGFDQGFDTYQQLTSDRTAAALNQLAQSWLDGNWSAVKSAERPLFLYLYYFDPHTWYTPPPPYDTLYDPDYTGPLTGEFYEHGEPVVSGAFTPTPRDLEHLIALYDGEIAYWDSAFGQMLAYLDGLALLDNSVIIVTSDHGQMFGEHGKWVHRSSLCEEVLRVPFIVRYPERFAGGLQIDEPVSLVDLTPTVLDLLDETAPAEMTGVSLLPLLEQRPWQTPPPVFSELDGVTDPAHSAYWIAPHTDLFAIKEDGWKYIHTAGSTTPTDHLFAVQPASPYEREDVLDAEPALAAALFEKLAARYQLPTDRLFLAAVLGDAPPPDVP